MPSFDIGEAMLNGKLDDILHTVFKFFDIMKLAKYSRVCKHWNYLISDVRLWKELEYSYWGKHGKLCCCRNKPSPEKRQSQIINSFIRRSPLLHTFRAVGIDFHETHSRAVILTLVKNCPRLKVLEFKQCFFTKKWTTSWQEIASAEWSLKHLILDSSYSDNNIIFEILLNSSKNLRALQFRSLSYPYDSTIEAVKQFANLTCFIVSEAMRSDSVIQILESIGSQLVQLGIYITCLNVSYALRKCTRLKILALGGVVYYFYKSLEIYGNTMTHLTHIQLRCYGSTTMEFLTTVFGVLCNLEFISIYSEPVEDSVVRCIAETCGKRLRYLSIMKSGAISDIVNTFPLMEYLQLLSSDLVMTQPLTDMTSKMPKLRTIGVKTSALKEQMSVIFPKAACLLWRDDQRWFPDLSEQEWRY